MKYYFSNDEYLDRYNLQSYSKQTQVRHLKDHSKRHLNLVKKKIGQAYNLDLDVAWISRATFGKVFVDFKPKKTGPSLLGIHKKLFDLISGDTKYLVLSKNISRNFIQKEIEDFNVLAINIDSYKAFVTTFRNQEKRVRLFLFKLNREEEGIVNNWIQAKPPTSRITERSMSQEDFLDYLSEMNIDSIDKFSSFLERVNIIFENKISTNLPMYQEKLNEFKGKIKDESLHETKLSEFLHKNIWILDFKYIRQHLSRLEKESATPSGNIDVYVSQEGLGVTDDVVIELKVPGKKITTTYSNKEVITAIVGRALSQAIHYMEEKKGKRRINRGILILGREKKQIIKLLDDRLHNIEIYTYEELAENCQKVLDAFKRSESDEKINSSEL